jgi:hypothetical protein
VAEFGVDPDVEDKYGATPVMYAMQLEKPHDWNTIKLLFELGAKTDAIVGDACWVYAELARAMGKEDLGGRLSEVA